MEDMEDTLVEDFDISCLLVSMLCTNIIPKKSAVPTLANPKAAFGGLRGSIYSSGSSLSRHCLGIAVALVVHVKSVNGIGNRWTSNEKNKSYPHNSCTLPGLEI